MAFEVFTDTCTRAHHRLELAQLDAAKLIPHAEPAAEGLKLEDSIFETHGSLGDQEDYQAQWLKDQAEADRQRLEAEAAATDGNQPGQSVGAPIDGKQQEKPASFSAGKMGETGDEKEAAAAGQASGGAPAADPDAQGSLPEVADGGLPAEGGAGEHGSPRGAVDHAPGGEKLEPQVAQPTGGEAGAAGDADSPQPVTKPPAKARKPAKGKSRQLN